MLAATADLERSRQDVAMVFITVPRQAGAVVEPSFHFFAQEIDKGAGQERVLQRWFVIDAGADDMKRTHVLPQLFADRAVIDEGGGQDAVGFGGAGQGLGAVAGRKYERHSV